MRSLFQHVYEVLKLISEITGFTYNEVNIIAYYILLPFLYIALADKIIKKHIFKLLYLVFVSVTLILYHLVNQKRLMLERFFDQSRLDEGMVRAP